MIIANRSREASAKASGFLPVPCPNVDISNPIQRNASAVRLSNNVAMDRSLDSNGGRSPRARVSRYWSDAGRNGLIPGKFAVFVGVAEAWISDDAGMFHPAY